MISIVLICIGFAIYNPIIFGFAALAGIAFAKLTMDTIESIKSLFFMNVLTVAVGTIGAIILLPATLLIGTVLSGAYVGALLYEQLPSKTPSPLPTVYVNPQ